MKMRFVEVFTLLCSLPLLAQNKPTQDQIERLKAHNQKLLVSVAIFSGAWESSMQSGNLNSTALASQLIPNKTAGNAAYELMDLESVCIAESSMTNAHDAQILALIRNNMVKQDIRVFDEHLRTLAFSEQFSDPTMGHNIQALVSELSAIRSELELLQSP